MPLSFDNEIVERLSMQLHRAKKVCIVSHQNPDGDAVGSALACSHWLREAFFAGEQKPEISIVLPHPCLEEALYLPGTKSIVNAKEDLPKCEQMLYDADLIWCVDFNAANRVVPLDKALNESKAVKVVVDHHHNPDIQLFDTILTLPDLSSTCELLYWLFVQIIGDNSITTNTARCLYHGINTDTGCFAYANEDASLYEATAALMRHPLQAAAVHNQIFNNYSIQKMKLLGFLLTERMKIFHDCGFAYIAVDDKDLEAHNATSEDLEGLVNYTLMMAPMRVGALVKISEGKVRISFRSKDDFDVNDFARRHFGGGGHTKASGATSPYDFNTTIKIMEENMLRELRGKTNTSKYPDKH